MKKILSIMCTVALLVGLMIPVSAAAALSLSTTSTTVTAGADFTVNVNFTGDDVQSGNATLTFTEGLTLKSSAAGTIWDSAGNTYTVPGASALKSGIVLRATLGTDPVANADGSLWVLTFTAPTTAGTYEIKVAPGTFRKGSGTKLTGLTTQTINITVQAATPTVTAKTATISSVTGGYVYATTTAWDGTTSVDLENLATTVTTAGTAADEKVYFYFVPKAGYTANITATKNGESFAITNGSTSKEDTLSANATYTFSFAPVAAGTPVASSIQVINPSADGVTIFGKATGATAFGALVGVSDNVAVNAGHTFAADSANADGEFAIELSGSAIFSADKTYAAKIFATNGATTVYSSSAAISY